MNCVLIFAACSVVSSVPVHDLNKALSERVEKLEEKVVKLTELVERSTSVRHKHAFNDAWDPVLFSAVLSDALYNIVVGQKIVFDKVFLNDGSGYNSNTGIFTVPMDGVYLFSYFVAEINDDQIVLRLVVNGQNKVDAVAEGLQNRHNDQGGNVVILKLAAGDLVYIEAYDTSNVHIDGGAGYQYTTFSGVMLYGQ